jgi:hypothetical protein
LTRRLPTNLVALVLLTALRIWGCQTPSGVTIGAPGVPPRLTATFIQLLDNHRTWNSEQWNTLFDYLENLGIDEAIIQWSVFNGRPFYGKPENDTLSTVLRIAEQRKMHVWIGLVHDQEYWARIQKTDGPLRDYLNASRNAMRLAAEELIACLDKSSNISGWYITQEIDDISFIPEEKRHILANHLKKLSVSLRQVAPSFNIAISGYTNLNAAPDALGEFWSEIIEDTSIDTVYFQDGIGVRGASWKVLETYYRTMMQALRRQDRRLRIVVELFEQVDGSPINELPFQAIPASWERIQKQIRLAAKYSTGNLAAFSIPEYATPMGGQQAEQLYQSFLKSARSE